MGPIYKSPIKFYTIDTIPKEGWRGPVKIVSMSQMDASITAHWNSDVIITSRDYFRLYGYHGAPYKLISFSLYIGPIQELSGHSIEVDCNNSVKTFQAPIFDPADGHTRRVITYRNVDMESAASRTEKDADKDENFCVIRIRHPHTNTHAYREQTGLRIGMITVQTLT